MTDQELLRLGIAQVHPTSNLEENLHTALHWIDEAASRGVELVCLPETHLPGYRVGILGADAPVDERGISEAERQVADRAAQHGIGVCIGTETPNSAGKPYNSAIVIDRDGREVVRHHKSKLTPKDEEGYACGIGPAIFDFHGIPMGIVICFEGFRFPETTRTLAHEGAKVVLHPQFNHVLEGAEWKLPVHEALVVARAAENTLYFATANMAHRRNNCRSLIIGPNGLIGAASELGREMLILADLDLTKSTHAFLRSDAAQRSLMLAER